MSRLLLYSALALLVTACTSGGLARLESVPDVDLNSYRHFSVELQPELLIQPGVGLELINKVAQALSEELIFRGLQLADAQTTAPVLELHAAIGFQNRKRDLMDIYGLGIRTGVSAISGFSADQGTTVLAIKVKERGQQRQLGYVAMRNEVQVSKMTAERIAKDIREALNYLQICGRGADNCGPLGR